MKCNFDTQPHQTWGLVVLFLGHPQAPRMSLGTQAALTPKCLAQKPLPTAFTLHAQRRFFTTDQLCDLKQVTYLSVITLILLSFVWVKGNNHKA